MSMYPSYEFVRMPDLASIQARNLLDGRIGAMFKHPDSLSPVERQDLADYLTQDDPDNTVLQMLAGVATNPLVWIGVMFATRFRLPTDVRRIFNVHEAASPIVKQYGGLLNMFGLRKLASEQQMFDGSSVSDILTGVRRGMEHIRTTGQRAVEDSMRAWGAATGRTSFDEIDDKLLATLVGGLHKRHMQTVRVGEEVRELADGVKVTVPIFKQVEVAPLFDAGLVEAEARRRGLMPVAEAIRKGYNDLWDEVFKSDASLTRIARGISQGSLGPRGKANDAAGLLSSLIGDDVVRAIRTGDLSEADVVSLIRSSIPKQTEFYLPRNTFNTYTRTHEGVVKATPQMLDKMYGEMKAPPMLRASRSTLGRRRPAIWDPNDLDGMEDFVSEATRSSFNEARESAREVVESLGYNEAGQTLRLSGTKTYSNYVESLSRTHALYGQELPKGVVEAMDRNQNFWQARAAVDPGFRKSLEAAGISFDPLHRSPKPLGGWSVFDALKREYTGLADDYAKSAVTNLWLPMATGTIRERQGILTGAAIASQQWTRAAMDGGLRGYLEKAGLGNLAGKVDGWASAELRGQMVDRGVARYFYGSTLGINLGSAVTNLTQGINLLRFAGPQDLAEGYAKAFRQYNGYIKDRMSQLRGGGKLLGAEARREREEILRKWFPGADDIGLAADIEADVERVLRSPRFFTEDSRFSRLEEGLLKVFTHTERFNRVVAMETATARAVRSGLNTRRIRTADGLSVFEDAETSRWVKRVVDETQFTPSPSNTPAAFLNPDNPLSNTVVRQFLTFPTRQLTSFWMGSRLGEAAPRALGVAVSPDLWKTAAISAGIYELMKPLGVDLFDVTPLGAGTAVYRDFGPFAPLPVPPVVSVSFGLLKFAATGEAEDFAYVAPLLVPGGVALNRALGFLPEVGESAADAGLSRKYVDYAQQTPDGQYAVMDGDGRVINYQSRFQLAATAVGLGRFVGTDREGEAIAYLANQRQNILELRRAYINALASNDTMRAEAVKREHLRKFGFELSVTESQLKSAMESSQQTRIQRMLETLPKDLRERVQPGIEQSLGISAFPETRPFVAQQAQRAAEGFANGFSGSFNQ